MCSIPALVGGFAIPPNGFGEILGHALAVVVLQSKVEARWFKALVGGLAVPLNRLNVILGHAFARVVPHAEVELCRCIALVGCLAVSVIWMRRGSSG